MASFFRKPTPNPVPNQAPILPKKSKMNDLFEPNTKEYLNPAVMNFPDAELHRKLIEAENIVKTAEETYKKNNTPETKDILDKSKKVFSDLMAIYEEKKKIKDIRETVKSEKEHNEWIKQREKAMNDVMDRAKPYIEESKRLNEQYEELIYSLKRQLEENEKKEMKELEEHQKKLEEIYSRGGKTRKYRKGSKKTMKKSKRRHRK
jgi:hypothetical protein